MAIRTYKNRKLKSSSPSFVIRFSTYEESYSQACLAPIVYENPLLKKTCFPLTHQRTRLLLYQLKSANNLYYINQSKSYPNRHQAQNL